MKRPERINVAMSRAMDRLVIVGASAMWRHRGDLPLADVLNCVEALAKDGHAIVIPSLTLEAAHEEAL